MREALYVAGMILQPSLLWYSFLRIFLFLMSGQDQAERTQVEGMLARFGQSTEYVPHLKARKPHMLCMCCMLYGILNAASPQMLCTDDTGQHQLSLCSVYGRHWFAQAGYRTFSAVSAYLS
jgi:hypothetical protein